MCILLLLLLLAVGFQDSLPISVPAAMLSYTSNDRQWIPSSDQKDNDRDQVGVQRKKWFCFFLSPFLLSLKAKKRRDMRGRGTLTHTGCSHSRGLLLKHHFDVPFSLSVLILHFSLPSLLVLVEGKEREKRKERKCESLLT